MPTINHIVNDFTHGELDPKMLSRPYLEIYNKSAISLQNMLVLPQGGVTKRFGLNFIEELNITKDFAFQITDFAHAIDTYYLLIFIPGKLRVYNKIDGSFVVEIVSPYTESELIANKLDFTHSKNSLVICNGDIPQQLVRGALPTDWVFSVFNFKRYPSYDFGDVDYDSFTFRLSSPETGTGITLTSSSAIFSNDYIHGIFQSLGASSGDEIGVARITAVTSNLIATVTVLQEFTGAIIVGVKGTDCVVRENIYTTNNGYPVSSTFIQNRLAFGATERLPALVAMSKPAAYTNFDTGTGEPDDAIVDLLQTDGISAIKYLIGEASLEVFTTDAEIVGSLSVDSDSSADSTSFHLQTHNGISNVAPQFLDNQVFFVTKGGKKLHNFMFDDTTRSFQSLDVSIFSPHLIKNPVSMTTLQNNPNSAADWLLIVNEDGTLIAYQSVLEQKVSAFTPLITDGSFQDVTRVDDEIFFIIKREINGADCYYLEQLNFNSVTDSNVINTYTVPTATITGLSHLEGKTLDVIADEIIYQTLTVTGGSVTLEKTATNVEAGLHYTPVVIPRYKINSNCLFVLL